MSKDFLNEAKAMKKFINAIKKFFSPYCPRCEVGRMNFERYDSEDGKKIYKCERCNTRAK